MEQGAQERVGLRIHGQLVEGLAKSTRAVLDSETEDPGAFSSLLQYHLLLMAAVSINLHPLKKQSALHQ